MGRYVWFGEPTNHMNELYRQCSNATNTLTINKYALEKERYKIERKKVATVDDIIKRERECTTEVYGENKIWKIMVVINGRDRWITYYASLLPELSLAVAKQ